MANRHGQTVMQAVCLSIRETTTDYEWGYQQYVQAVGIAPNAILTDADPASTAAVATVFPKARHLWCLWHIHQNLRKNLGTKLGSEFMHFQNDFKYVQQQISPTVFKELYNRLLEVWPQAKPYLDENLSKNTRFWAGYRFDVFTTGAISTQRGEGLNRHVKHHLNLQSPLTKLYAEVLVREQKEQARATVKDVLDMVSSLTLLHLLHTMPFLPTAYLALMNNLQECRTCI